MIRFATFSRQGGPSHLGLMVSDERLLDLSAAATGDPALASMIGLISAGPAAIARAEAVSETADAAMVLALDEVRLLAPIPRPAKNVFCVGLNYPSHVEANARALGIRPEVGEVPLFFSKPTTSVIGTETPIRLDDRITDKLDYEVELGIVIGQGGTWIDEADALDHVFGYTLVNDVSARDVQWRTSQMFIGKGLDTYCPMGPWIVARGGSRDWSEFELRCRVNGEERQRDSTANLIFSVPRIIAELSKGLTLEPGDIISTGSPGGCGYQMLPPQFLKPGDVVECSAEGLGRLVNTVAATGEPAEAGGTMEDMR